MTTTCSSAVHIIHDTDTSLYSSLKYNKPQRRRAIKYTNTTTKTLKGICAILMYNKI